MNYNKVINIEDFGHAELREIIRDVFAHEIDLFPPNYPDGVADSKQWEIAMAIRALRDGGALHDQSRLLGVGAGTEITSFYLTKFVDQVFATDIYASSHVWADIAPAAFLVDPAKYSSIEYREDRLIPMHMDALNLRFPDNYFDGVYSSGSIEHFGSPQAVSNSAFEIGRVLKPNGIATISTEFKIAGRPDQDWWDPNVILFTLQTLKKNIVEASGLELIDDIDAKISRSTLSQKRDLLPFLEGTRGPFSVQKKIAHYPNLILYHEGFLFCSVHLALRKTPSYPAANNAWARPDAAPKKDVSQTISAPGSTSKVSNKMPTSTYVPPEPALKSPTARQFAIHRNLLKLRSFLLRHPILWHISRPLRRLYQRIQLALR